MYLLTYLLTSNKFGADSCANLRRLCQRTEKWRVQKGILSRGEFWEKIFLYFRYKLVQFKSICVLRVREILMQLETGALVDVISMVQCE